MAESYGSEHVRNGLNAIGNPEVEYRSAEGGMPGKGYLGQVHPTGILSTGSPDRALWKGRTTGSERTPGKGKR